MPRPPADRERGPPPSRAPCLRGALQPGAATPGPGAVDTVAADRTTWAGSDQTTGPVGRPAARVLSLGGIARPPGRRGFRTPHPSPHLPDISGTGVRIRL